MVVPLETPVVPLAWSSCREDFECAVLTVPLDHGAPGGRTTPIALLRAPARRAAQGERLGSLVVNPGGPGAPMVERLARTYLTVSLAFPELADRFDVIAFDWRGVGESAPVQCVDDSFFDAARAVDLTLQSPGSVSAVEGLVHTLTEGCLAHADLELLARMDTESAARDLDYLRAALGEERLNFIGFSYGTLLGATYATLFPGHTGALVLDSAVAPGLTLTDALTARAASRDDSLERFFAACAADKGCDLGGGSDAATVAARFDALVASVRASGPIPAGDRSLGVTDLALAINEGLRSAKWLPFGDALARAEAGDGKALLARADAAALRRPDGSYETAFLGLLAVGCLEQPLAPGETLASLQALVAGFSPGAASASVPYALCAGWPWKRTRPAVAIAAPTAPPSLVISSRHDPITPYAEGSALVSALGNGSHLLTHEGGGHIASFQNACVRAEITRFVLSPSSTPATSCAEE